VELRLANVLVPGLPVQVERQRRGGGAFIIEHPIEQGVVFACSEDVARAGVQPGLSIYQAQQLAPQVVVVAADELTYHALHSAGEAALRAFSPALETVALGEFLVDVRHLPPHFPDDAALAQALRAAAQTASGLNVAVGLAASKFVAQQAALAAAANGVFVVAPGEEAAFVAPLPLTVLPNLPGEYLRRLQLFDLYTLGDLARLPKPAVLRQFGGAFSSLYELARGRDPRPLNLDVPPLRLVRSFRLAEPVRERAILLNVVTRLGRQLSRALSEKGYHAEAVKLTLTGAQGQCWEQGQALKPPTSSETTLCRQAAQLLGRLPVNAPVESAVLSGYPLRSWHLGLHQRALAEAGVAVRQTKLETTLQLLWHRFGETAVRLAALLGPPLPLKIEVGLNAQGLPARLKYGGQVRAVLGIEETWREEREWWAQPVRRDYFRVRLGDGSWRHIYQDLLTGEWRLDRAWLWLC
jgi:DNA polymerase-4